MVAHLWHSGVQGVLLSKPEFAEFLHLTWRFPEAGLIGISVELEKEGLSVFLVTHPVNVPGLPHPQTRSWRGANSIPSPLGTALPCAEHCGRAVFSSLTLAPGSSWGPLRAWSTAHSSRKRREGYGRQGLFLWCRRA